MPHLMNRPHFSYLCFLKCVRDLKAKNNAIAAENRRLSARIALLVAECKAGRKCWIITNNDYVVPSENVDELAIASEATDDANAMGETP